MSPMSQFNAAQLTAIANELNTDPLGYGYATHIAAGQYADCAVLLNTMTTTNITLSSISKGDLLKITTSWSLQLSTGKNLSGTAFTSAQIAHWQYWFQTLAAADSTIDLTDQTILGMLSMAVSDGLTASTTNVTQRLGTRAEVILALQGASIEWWDVAAALGKLNVKAV